MDEGEHSGEVGEVYKATSPSEIAEIYDRWSATYDDYMDQIGYRHPAICVSLLARHVDAVGMPVLDAGVGTGLIGELMRLIGYERIDGIDLSAAMLAKARVKNIYRDLRIADMTKPLDLADNYYAGIISCGVFKTGHVGSEGLPPLIDVCRPGGHIVTTVKAPLWETDFSPAVDRLVIDGIVSLVERTPPYVSMRGEAGTVPSLAIVLKKR